MTVCACSPCVAPCWPFPCSPLPVQPLALIAWSGRNLQDLKDTNKRLLEELHSVVREQDLAGSTPTARAGQGDRLLNREPGSMPRPPRAMAPAFQAALAAAELGAGRSPAACSTPSGCAELWCVAQVGSTGMPGHAWYVLLLLLLLPLHVLLLYSGICSCCTMSAKLCKHVVQLPAPNPIMAVRSVACMCCLCCS